MTPEEAVLRWSESALSREVYAMAHRARWLAHGIRRTRGQNNSLGQTGFPDWVFIRPPRLILVELKDQKSQPYDNQNLWLDAARHVPGIETYIWRPSDILSGEIERVLL